MRFSIIIPCYNEGENIYHLVDRIRPLQEKYDLEYVLVENGSQDNSREIFLNEIEGKYDDIKIAYVDINQGYGYGLQQGLKKASGDYVGWIHADLQISPEDLVPFFDYVNANADEKHKLFLKGNRTNRSAFDNFFTNGQSVYNSILFGRKIHDVGAIPVLFERSLIKDVDLWPNDFSIELYVYVQAKKAGFEEKRFKVVLLKREKGKSSWNTGFKSKVRQSKRIFNDSLLIKKGKKVL